MKKDNSKDVEKVYRHYRRTLGVVPEAMKVLGKYMPEVLWGYYAIREYMTREPPKAALPRRVKELIWMALASISKAPPHLVQAHARAAIKAGAKKGEVAEAMALVMIVAGVPAYIASGAEIIRAAEEAEAELAVASRRGRQA